MIHDDGDTCQVRLGALGYHLDRLLYRWRTFMRRGIDWTTQLAPENSTCEHGTLISWYRCPECGR